jgi:hypothetical protein
MLLAQILMCISFYLKVVTYYTSYLVEGKTLTTEVIIILLIYFVI